MAFSPQHYTARIAEVKKESEARARELISKAGRGEITWTEAWYSLPGPEPIVQEQLVGYSGSLGVMHYVVQYPFLSNGDAAAIKKRMEEEFRAAMTARDTAMSAIPTRHESTSQELKTSMETARKTFDVAVIGVASRQAQVDELRAKLAAYEKAYETELRGFEEAKREKDRTEAAHLDYTSKASALMQVAKAESEVAIDGLAKHRDGNAARIKTETEAWYGLWKARETNAFEERGRAAEAQVQAARERALQTRIEEEARRRLNVDAEFEAAVAARLQQMMK